MTESAKPAIVKSKNPTVANGQNLLGETHQRPASAFIKSLDNTSVVTTLPKALSGPSLGGLMSNYYTNQMPLGSKRTKTERPDSERLYGKSFNISRTADSHPIMREMHDLKSERTDETERDFEK
jgi:hypothetical protein